MPLRYISSKEDFLHQIVTMNADGWSIRALSRHFDISRNMVRRILRSHQAKRDQGHDILPKKQERSSKLTPFMPLMKLLIEEFPDITGVRMVENLKDGGYDGGKTIVTDHLRVMRPKPKREPVVRFETSPGVQGQMDWSPYTIPFVKTGKTTVLCFSYILGFSRRQYIDFTTDRKFHTLIRRHQDAFSYFNGAPKTCLYDNEKTVVLRWEAGQPLYNPAFVAFITHYQCRPIACKPRRPETKGKIEAPFQYVENNFLNARKFEDIEDIRNCARWWLENKSDVHIHDTTKRMPIELFMEQEKSSLLSLPPHPYDSSEVALRVCRTDGFLEHDTNLYSVPYEYVADILTIKATEHEIFIYSPDLDLIAHHERQPPVSGAQIELVEHRKSKKIRYGLEPVRQSFLQLGPCAEQFINGLKDKYPKNCGFHARHILGLKSRYHAEDIHQALIHAIRYYAFDGKAIENILKVRAKTRALESTGKKQAKKILQNALPEIRQRQLSEYAGLLSQEEDTTNENN
jgi:transposase